jgi:hypothetical protein
MLVLGQLCYAETAQLFLKSAGSKFVLQYIFYDDRIDDNICTWLIISIFAISFHFDIIQRFYYWEAVPQITVHFPVFHLVCSLNRQFNIWFMQILNTAFFIVLTDIKRHIFWYVERSYFMAAFLKRFCYHKVYSQWKKWTHAIWTIGEWCRNFHLWYVNVAK